MDSNRMDSNRIADANRMDSNRIADANRIDSNRIADANKMDSNKKVNLSSSNNLSSEDKAKLVLSSVLDEQSAETAAETAEEETDEESDEDETDKQAEADEDAESDEDAEAEKKAPEKTPNDYIYDYYLLKAAYEKMLYRYKRKTKTQHIKCINCKKDGGTIFSNTDGILIAKCNATKHCKLDIEIHRGKIIQLTDLENSLYKKLNEYKSKIVCLKLDLMFGYTDEENTIELFKKNNLLLSNNEKLLYECHNYEFNMNKDREKLLNEYKETMNTELNDVKMMLNKYNEDKNNHKVIEDITTKYVQVIYPLIEKIRDTKYKTSNVECDDNDCKLIQHEFNIEDMEMYVADKTTIVRYNI